MLSRAELVENKPRIMKSLKKEFSHLASEETREILTYLRDYLIGLIDITTDVDQIDLFELHVKLAL